MKEVPRVISFGKTNNMKQNISKTKEKKCCYSLEIPCKDIRRG